MNKLIILCLLSFPVYADKYHTTKVEKSNIAISQLNFDFNTRALQLSGGIGSDNSTALGLGRRFGDVLYTGSTSSQGTALGFTLRFK